MWGNEELIKEEIILFKTLGYRHSSKLEQKKSE